MLSRPGLALERMASRVETSVKPATLLAASGVDYLPPGFGAGGYLATLQLLTGATKLPSWCQAPTPAFRVFLQRGKTCKITLAWITCIPVR